MTDSIEALERKDELTEERKAAEGKPRKLTLDVTSMPDVTRNESGDVTHVVLRGKARFKGDIEVHLRGDVASAYWSVTPGMSLIILAIEAGDKMYDAEHVDIIARA